MPRSRRRDQPELLDRYQHHGGLISRGLSEMEEEMPSAFMNSTRALIDALVAAWRRSHVRPIIYDLSVRPVLPFPCTMPGVRPANCRGEPAPDRRISRGQRGRPHRDTMSVCLR
jgi:hypothetical protein